MDAIFLRNFPIAEINQYVLAIQELGDANVIIRDDAYDKQNYRLYNIKSLWYSGSSAEAITALGEIDRVRAEHFPDSCSP